MSVKEKMVARLLSIPADYTFFELKSLSIQLGCSISQKRNGSRCVIVTPSGAKRVIHKPHSYCYFKEYAIKDIVSFFREEGLL